MRIPLTYLVVALLSACAVRKLQVPTTALDLKTGNPVAENSIRLPRGTICYIYTPRYDSWLFDDASLFRHTTTTDFTSYSSSTPGFGVAYRSSKVDTVVHNGMLVRVALREALRNAPMGSQYQYVPRDSYAGPGGARDTALLRRKFHPAVIINLESFSVKMTGSAHAGGSSLMVTTGIVNACCYAMSVDGGSSYGNILMDYTAVWRIRDTQDHTERSIEQKGRYVSTYHGQYSIHEEVMNCAEKAGREFSGLIRNNYRHVY